MWPCYGFLNLIKCTLWRLKLNSLGNGCKFYKWISIYSPQKVSIGSNVAIGDNVIIWGGGGVFIGNSVMIAAHTVVSSQSHDPDASNPSQTHTHRPIYIMDRVWIGANSCILQGVTINEGAVVAAGCVVTKDVPKNAIYAGNPGKIIRYKSS